MEILLTGNTGYVTASFVESAFPNSHIVINGACSITKETRNIRLIHPSDLELGKDVLDVYEFDLIVFFSNYLTYHGNQEGEMVQLRTVLQYCRGRKTRMLYLAGPAASFSTQTGKTILASSAENLCLHYLDTARIQLKIIHLPFLYSTTYKDDFIYQLFAAADTKQEIILEEHKDQPAAFLSLSDLSDLLYRICDSWDMDHEIIHVPDVFSITFEQLAAEIQNHFPETAVEFTEHAPIEQLPKDDKVIRKKYGWFPKISILSDMDQLYQDYCANQEQKDRFSDIIVRWLKGHSKIWKFVELLLFFVIAEMLTKFVGNHSQFRVIDIRLLYIVTIGTIYGMNMGILAAALVSVALIRDFAVDGIGWVTLFYEPSNWIPFILYFLIAAICGYLQMKNENSISFLTKENALLRKKFSFMKNLYQDAAQEKRDLKHQILSSKDSFGKIYEITRKLDSVRPQEIFMKTLRVMENILENNTISIYSIGRNPYFARLEASSREISAQAPRSLKIEDYSCAWESINTGNVWVNQKLDPAYPMYMVGIKRNERLVLLVMVQSAEYSQMNLYYQNLLKILCGLVETALLRALNYQEALFEEQHVQHSIFMKESYFREKLALYHSMQEERIADYTLVKLDRSGMTFDEAEEILKAKTRENDTVGISDNQQLYLILHQTSPSQADIAISRLQAAGFGCEIISHDPWDEN